MTLHSTFTHKNTQGTEQRSLRPLEQTFKILVLIVQEKANKQKMQLMKEQLAKFPKYNDQFTIQLLTIQ